MEKQKLISLDKLLKQLSVGKIGKSSDKESTYNWIGVTVITDDDEIKNINELIPNFDVHKINFEKDVIKQISEKLTNFTGIKLITCIDIDTHFEDGKSIIYIELISGQSMTEQIKLIDHYDFKDALEQNRKEVAYKVVSIQKKLSYLQGGKIHTNSFDEDSLANEIEISDESEYYKNSNDTKENYTLDGLSYLYNGELHTDLFDEDSSLPRIDSDESDYGDKKKI